MQSGACSGYPCRHVHPGRGTGRAHLRRHRRRIGHQRRLGGQGADREGAQDARPRARPRREASRLSDGDDGELGVRGPQPAAAQPTSRSRRSRTAPATRRTRRRRTGSSTTSRIPTPRSSASTGCAATTSAAARCCGGGSPTASAIWISRPTPRRRRRRLADPLRGHRAVVRLRRALRRHQRQPRRPAAAARRPVPAADGDELPREPGEGPHRQGVRRPADDHRPRGEPDAAAQRPRRLPVPEPLHPRLPVRRLLQQQRRDAARRLRHRQADAPPVLDRDRADLRPEDTNGRPACASSTRRRTRRRSTSRA